MMTNCRLCHIRHKWLNYTCNIVNGSKAFTIFVCLLHADMFSVDELDKIFPTRWGHRIHFWGGETHWSDSLTRNIAQHDNDGRSRSSTAQCGLKSQGGLVFLTFAVLICRGENFNHFPQVMLSSMQFRLKTCSMYRKQMLLWICKHAWDPQPSLLFLTISHSTQYFTAHHTPPSVLSLSVAGRPAISVRTPECCSSPVRCGLPNVSLLCSDWPQQRHGQLWPYSQCHYHKVHIHIGCVVWALDRTSTNTVNCTPVLAATNTQCRCITLKQCCIQ